MRWRRWLLWAEFALVIAVQLYAVAAAFARQPIIPAGRAFTCTAVAIWDGDGPIWCREGARLRLAGVAARELDGSCRPGHPCPAASGIAARERLAQLLGGARGRTADGHVLIDRPRLACRSAGPDRYRRTLASCSLGGRDLGAALIAAGVALPWHPRRI